MADGIMFHPPFFVGDLSRHPKLSLIADCVMSAHVLSEMCGGVVRSV